MARKLTKSPKRRKWRAGIDRLGNPSQQTKTAVRKLRLLKGPREFRDGRVNRARA